MSDRRGSDGYLFAVWPVNEARANLPSILDRFGVEGPLSPPVIIGRHRKPEAALVPYRLLARLLQVYEEQRAPQMLAATYVDRASAPDSDYLTPDTLT